MTETALRLVISTDMFLQSLGEGMTWENHWAGGPHGGKLPEIGLFKDQNGLWL